MVAVYAIINFSIVAHVVSELVANSAFANDRKLKPFVTKLANFSHDSPLFIGGKLTGCIQLVITCYWFGEKWFIIAYSLSAVFAILAYLSRNIEISDSWTSKIRSVVVIYSGGVILSSWTLCTWLGHSVIEAMDMAGALLIPAYFSSLVTEAFEKDSWVYTILFNLSGFLLGYAAWHYGMYHVVAIEVFASLIQLGSLALARYLKTTAKYNAQAFYHFVSFISLSRTIEGLTDAGENEE